MKIEIAYNAEYERYIYRVFKKKPADKTLNQLRANIQLFYELSKGRDFDASSELSRFLISSINEGSNDYELILNHFSGDSLWRKVHIAGNYGIASAGFDE